MPAEKNTCSEFWRNHQKCQLANQEKNYENGREMEEEKKEYERKELNARRNGMGNDILK
jgi:hypothetical protein